MTASSMQLGIQVRLLGRSLVAENRLTTGRQKMPPNNTLQLTANPLRGLSAAELGR